MRTFIALALFALFTFALAETATQAVKAQAATPVQSVKAQSVKSQSVKSQSADALGKRRGIICRRVKKCVSYRLKCVRRIRRDHCAAWGVHRQRFVARYTCANYRKYFHGTFEEDENESRAAARRGFLRFTSNKSMRPFARHCSNWQPVYGYRNVPYCKRYVRINQCVAKKVVCRAVRLVRRCFRRVVRRRVVGPSSCPRGFYLVFNRRGRVIVRSCVRGTPNNRVAAVCNSYGDPHFKTFDNVYYSFYKNGDYLLAKTLDGAFAVHARHYYTKRWATFSLNSAYAVLVNAKDVFTYNANTKRYTLNGRTLAPRVGSTLAFPNGGSVRFFNLRYVQITAPNGAGLTASTWFAGHNEWAINLAVTSSRGLLNKWKGLCGNFTGRRVNSATTRLVRGLFNHTYHPAIVVMHPKSWKNAQQRKEAYAFCRAAKLNRNRFADCLFDYRAGGRKFAMLSIKLGTTIVMNTRPARQ